MPIGICESWLLDLLSPETACWAYGIFFQILYLSRKYWTLKVGQVKNRYIELCLWLESHFHNSFLWYPCILYFPVWKLHHIPASIFLLSICGRDVYQVAWVFVEELRNHADFMAQKVADSSCCYELHNIQVAFCITLYVYIYIYIWSIHMTTQILFLTINF